MATIRQDAWTKEEDDLLQETVLSYIRGGKTQLSAFEEVSNRIGRTAFSCGFRWNKTVRKRCEEAIREARKEARAQLKSKSIRATSSGIPEKNDLNDDIAFAISLLNRTKQLVQRLDILQRMVQKATEELDKLQEENRKLRNSLQESREVQADYKRLVGILGMKQEEFPNLEQKIG